MPQLEELTTKNIQLCTGGLWGEKGNNKIFKKKKILFLFVTQLRIYFLTRSIGNSQTK